MAHGSEDAEGEVKTGKDVADTGADLHRGLGIWAGDGDQAAHGLGDDVVGRPGAVGAQAGARVAEAAHGGVDQGGVLFCQGFVGQAETLHDAGAEVFGNDMGGLGEVEEGLFAGLGLEVEDDGFLGTVEADEIAAPLVLRVV